VNNQGLSYAMITKSNENSSINMNGTKSRNP